MAAVLGSAQRLGQQRRQRAREGIYLMGREHGPVHQLRLVLGEHAFETEQQRELPPPGGRGILGLWVLLDLRQRLVERAPARRVRGQRDGRILAVVQEALAHELLRPGNIGGVGNGRGHEGH